MTTGEVIRKFSRTPLKHRMSKYLLEYIVDNKDLLSRIVFVTARNSLPDTMLIAQAGVEGPSFELELGATERKEVSLVNGRLIKQTKKVRSLWIHDPVQAVEALRGFKGKLHVQLLFSGETPDWYEEVAVMDGEKVYNQQLISEQISLALKGIILKHEIDQALVRGDKAAFEVRVKQYKEICRNCLWQF